SDEVEETKRSVIGLEKLNENDIAYLNGVLSSVKEHKPELTKIIDERSRLFPESRLFPADRSILFIAIAEILYFNDIPSAVSVNEAANIASKYSSEKSATFISGILSEIIREHDNV
ncbi:MAG: transcription antitermination protein NusB, partial [Clostridia bacterium]|nr:transcription antitermination protein NusB [Clostridia bacterium]